MTDTQPYLVPAIETAVRVLTFLEERGQAAQLHEFAGALGVPRSSMQNVLRTLHTYRLLRYDETSRQYDLGSRLISLGARAAERKDEIALARPHLQQLARDCQVTSLLVQRLEGGYIYIDRVESPTDVRVTIDIGVLYPWRGGAVTRAFLARITSAEARPIVDAIVARADGLGVRVNQDAYLGELAEVRERGYAVSRGEVVPGINSVAALIPEDNRPPRLALATLGTSAALPETALREIGLRLREAASAIAQELGASPVAAVPGRPRRRVSTPR